MQCKGISTPRIALEFIIAISSILFPSYLLLRNAALEYLIDIFSKSLALGTKVEVTFCNNTNFKVKFCKSEIKVVYTGK